MGEKAKTVEHVKSSNRDMDIMAAAMKKMQAVRKLLLIRCDGSRVVHEAHWDWSDLIAAALLLTEREGEDGPRRDVSKRPKNLHPPYTRRFPLLT